MTESNSSLFYEWRWMCSGLVWSGLVVWLILSTSITIKVRWLHYQRVVICEHLKCCELLSFQNEWCQLVSVCLKSCFDSWFDSYILIVGAWGPKRSVASWLSKNTVVRYFPDVDCNSSLQYRSMSLSSLNTDILLHLMKFVNPVDRFNLIHSGIRKCQQRNRSKTEI